MFRNIPLVTRNLLIANILAFLATIVLKSAGISLEDLGGLHFFLAQHFHVYQFITYQFLHANFAHLFFNMFALWMFGCVIENVWGPKKFLFYYITCGIGAGLCQELVQYVTYASEGLAAYEYVTDGSVRMTVSAFLDNWCTIGASGAVYAILLAFGMTFPEERIFIFPLPVPIKAKWFVIIYAVIELVSAVTSSGDGVAHMAHLGGMLFGFLLIRYWRRHPERNFNMSSGQQFFDRFLRRGSGRSGYSGNTGYSGHSGFSGNATNTWQANHTATREDDMEYNARKRARQAEVDAILDKIRKSGYDSLTKEEKQRLFEASRER